MADTSGESPRWYHDVSLADLGIVLSKNQPPQDIIGITNNAIRHLYSIIPKEPWKENEEDLRISHKACNVPTFKKLRTHLLKMIILGDIDGKINACDHQDRRYFVFHTMLLSHTGEEIFGILTRTDESSPCKAGHMWHIRTFSNIGTVQNIELCQKYHLPPMVDQDDLPYGPSFFRLHQEPALTPCLWSNALAYSQFIDPETQDLHNVAESYASGASSEETLARIRKDCERARNMSLVNPRLAVPYPHKPFSRTDFEIWWLLPIYPITAHTSEFYPVHPKHCMAVAKYIDTKGQPMCRVQAILETRKAYWQARLVGPVDQDWLKSSVAPRPPAKKPFYPSKKKFALKKKLGGKAPCPVARQPICEPRHPSEATEERSANKWGNSSDSDTGIEPLSLKDFPRLPNSSAAARKPVAAPYDPDKDKSDDSSETSSSDSE